MRHDKWDELVENSSLFCRIKNEGSEVELIRHYLPPQTAGKGSRNTAQLAAISHSSEG